MNDEILKAIHEELVAIRKLLAESNAKPAAAPARSTASRSTTASSSSPASSSYSSGSRSGASEEIPQPTEVIADAGDVQIHFGKNNGVPLSQLNERSLSWYAQEQAPRLDSSGKPYPPRPQDVTLRNAARTLWHQNRGTLAKGGAAAKSTAGAEELPIDSSAHVSDEEVPF